MNETTTSPTETAEPFSGRDHADTGTTNGFTPLHSDNPLCVIGYPSNATAPDLYDAATLRHSAALGVLCVLSSAPDLTLQTLCGRTIKGSRTQGIQGDRPPLASIEKKAHAHAVVDGQWLIRAVL